jgi:hypothetical protein
MYEILGRFCSFNYRFISTIVKEVYVFERVGTSEFSMKQVGNITRVTAVPNQEVDLLCWLLAAA